MKLWRDELYKEMEERFYTVEVERKLRIAKREIRESAHRGLILRAQDAPSAEDAKKWQADATAIVKRFAGDPAEFDFMYCLDLDEPSGDIDLERVNQIRKYLWAHTRHLKELAQAMDATDLDI